jgi:hypothetical protein
MRLLSVANDREKFVSLIIPMPEWAALVSLNCGALKAGCFHSLRLR